MCREIYLDIHTGGLGNTESSLEGVGHETPPINAQTSKKQLSDQYLTGEANGGPWLTFGRKRET